MTAAASPDPALVGAAMAWAPIVGLALGGVASTVLVLASAAVGGNAALLPAALAVTSLILMTGALHLDGLADTADAMGVRGGPAEAREAAKQPATGAFGVTAVAVVVLLDVVAVATAAEVGRGVTALVVGCASGRLAATWACRAEPPASEVGLGTWVAGTVRARSAVAASIATVAVCAAVAVADNGHRVAALSTGMAALAASLLVGALARRVGCRAFGGLTGDVLGATISCGATAAYVVVALTGSLVR